MDEQTLKTMPEYFQKLPKHIRDFIFDGEWEGRTKEVAGKYSLNEKQSEDLADNVLMVLMGIDEPDVFYKSITSDLSVSNIIAEQIMDDLEKRVFEYALKEIEPKIKDGRRQDASATTNVIPEIRPQMTPAIEKGEVAHTTPSTISVPRYAVPENLPTEHEAAPTNNQNMPPKVPEPPKPIERKPVEPAPQKYSADPYREPLE
jgi:hypothetical protein